MGINKNSVIILKNSSVMRKLNVFILLTVLLFPDYRDCDTKGVVWTCHYSPKNGLPKFEEGFIFYF